jgi:hypothetical protein
MVPPTIRIANGATHHPRSLTRSWLATEIAMVTMIRGYKFLLMNATKTTASKNLAA